MNGAVATSTSRTGTRAIVPRMAEFRWLILVCLWLGGLAVGVALVIDHDTRPGQANDGRLQWPAGTSLRLSPTGKTLLMFLHPRCPCSQASVTELAQLLQNEQPRPRLYVVVPHENLAGPDEVSRALEPVAALDDLSVVMDPEGTETRRFGSHTSGTLLVFDADGRCNYAGGLTSARGHVGPNMARDAAAAALHGLPHPDSMPVFGCPLF